MQSIKYQVLTDSQRKAVFHAQGPLLVIAGPGSGKTRVITYRIAALIDSGVRPYNICAITFTNKAADEMRQRAMGLGASGGAYISTFHSLCVRLLRQYADKAGINPNFSIYDDSDQSACVKQAIKECNLDASNFSPARMLHAISTLKNNLEDVDSFKMTAEDFFSRALAKVYTRYQQILSERNGLDFDDLLMKTAFMLRDNPDVCAEIANRFKFLLVDEYQDTNQAQYRIAKSIASIHRNICVTGDPDQSIYRWRGADIRNILAFEQDWPDAVVVKLEENFRSTPDILELADNLIAANKKRKAKSLIPTRPRGREVVFGVFEDEHQEARGVAQYIKELVKNGTSPREIAVFYRINSMSRVLEEAFIENQIPYQIVRGVEFYGRKEIRDMVAYLKVLVNPNDQAAVLRIINTPARGIGKTTTDKVIEYAEKNRITFFEALKKAALIDSLSKGTKDKLAAFVNMMEQFRKGIDGPVGPLAERVFVESGLEKSMQFSGNPDKSELENIKELINAAAQYDKQIEKPSLVDYLQQIALFSDADMYDESNERVALMTLHAAKGLEFENVFIVGLEDGLLPHERSRDDEDEMEEERRLFFVGITRAKAGLHITYSKYRNIRGQLLRAMPSQFLFELKKDFGPYPQNSKYHYDADNQSDYEDEDDENESAPRFVKNQMVHHKKFGPGRVELFNDMGENSVVVVKFSTGQTKTLMVKYAGLSDA